MSANEAKNDVAESVKDYYGKQLKTGDDLQTTACTTSAQKMPKYLREIIAMIHDVVVNKYYGCGLAVPTCLKDKKILDLGSGSGRDCYALSKLVGKNGFVTGIDMTDEQLEVANRHIAHHTQLFGYEKPNLKFVKGYIENLADAGIEDKSIDIIISNCVINLCKDKKLVLEEAFRVLKDGGELYFTDMYADRVVAEEIRNNPVLWGEGMGGALYWKKLYDLAREIGFEIPRTVTLSSMEVKKPELKPLVGDTKYASVLYRLFKLPSGANRATTEVVYNGTVQHNEKVLKFDLHNTFQKNERVIVDGATAAILKNSRFKNDFTFKESSDNPKTTPIEEKNPFEILASGDVTFVSNTCSSVSAISGCS